MKIVISDGNGQEEPIVRLKLESDSMGNVKVVAVDFNGNKYASGNLVTFRVVNGEVVLVRHPSVSVPGIKTTSSGAIQEVAY